MRYHVKVNGKKVYLTPKGKIKVKNKLTFVRNGKEIKMDSIKPGFALDINRIYDVKKELNDIVYRLNPKILL